jgi:hypothetical protein
MAEAQSSRRLQKLLDALAHIGNIPGLVTVASAVAAAFAATSLAVWKLIGKLPVVVLVLLMTGFFFGVLALILFIGRRISHRSEIRQIQIGRGESPAPIREPATPERLRANYLYQETIRMSDLAPQAPGLPIVRGKTFERCVFLGPAVITFLNSIASGMGFFLDTPGQSREVLAEAFIEIETPRMLYGVVLFQECIFRNCSFMSISIAGSREDIDKALAEFKPSSEAEVSD